MTATEPSPGVDFDTEPGNDTDSLPLSVVIITENEEDRIEGCIESVIAAAQRAVSAFEIVLVDSASTDRTVELASKYPVTVLRIPEEETISCGAGRYVGDHAIRGDLVLHVDGDMRLSETWLAEAVEALATDPKLAAVEGWLNESEASEPTPVKKVGGVMCYDSDALDSVGGFDPFLQGYEDVDVGYRLTAEGYRLTRLPSVSAEHPTGEGDLSEPIRRWRHGYLFAPGQTIRKSAGQPQLLGLLLGRQRYEGAMLGWLGLGIVSTRSRRLFLGWVAASLLGFGAVARRLGVRGALQFGIAKLLGLVGLVYGLSLRADDPSDYPLESVQQLQEGERFVGTASTTDDAA
jgi:glycosyltransferase involved in cell wall biosynthesis